MRKPQDCFCVQQTVFWIILYPYPRATCITASGAVRPFITPTHALLYCGAMSLINHLLVIEPAQFFFHFTKERTHSCEIFMIRKAPCSRKSFTILIYHEACGEKEVVSVGTMSANKYTTNTFGPKFLKHVPLKRTLYYQHKVLLR